MGVAAVVAVVLLGGALVFQILLALGAPFGAASWGGQHPGRLPSPLRIASGVAGFVVYPVAIAVVLAAAGFTTAGWMPGSGAVLLSGFTGFFALGALVNLVSRSRVERVWAPVSLGIAACCALIAAGL